MAKKFLKSATRATLSGFVKNLPEEQQRPMSDLIQSTVMRHELTFQCGLLYDATVAISDGATPTAVDWTGITATIDTDSFASNGGWTVPVGFAGVYLVFGQATFTLGGGAQASADAIIVITNGGTEVCRGRVVYDNANQNLAINCIGLVTTTDGDVLDLRLAVDTNDASASSARAYFGFVRVAD